MPYGVRYPHAITHSPLQCLNSLRRPFFPLSLCWRWGRRRGATRWGPRLSPLCLFPLSLYLHATSIDIYRSVHNPRQPNRTPSPCLSGGESEKRALSEKRPLELLNLRILRAPICQLPPIILKSIVYRALIKIENALERTQRQPNRTPSPCLSGGESEKRALSEKRPLGSQWALDPPA